MDDTSSRAPPQDRLSKEGPLLGTFLHFPSNWLYSSTESKHIFCFPIRIIHSVSTRIGNIIVIWESRRNRKHLGLIQNLNSLPLPSLHPNPISRYYWGELLLPWHPEKVSWWTAVLYTIGSAAFLFSSIAALIPKVINSLYLSTAYVGWTAFTASLFFTIGSVFGIAELFVAPNDIASEEIEKINSEEKNNLIDSTPNNQFEIESPTNSPVKDNSTSSSPNVSSLEYSCCINNNYNRIDLWLAIINLIGSIGYSINTFASSGSFLLTEEQTIGWVDFPDIFASTCFTISGYMSVMEVTQSLWNPLKSEGLLASLSSLDWHLTWCNFAGGFCFLLNGFTLLKWPLETQYQNAISSLIGSIFFQIGSYLQYVEQSDEYVKEHYRSEKQQHQAK